MRKRKKKNLRINVSNIYIIVAFMFILGFGFFGTSKLFIAENIEVNQTALNQEYDLKSNGKFTINEWTYDKEKNLMEIILITNGMENYMTSLDFTAISKDNVGKKLPAQVVFNENDIYILHVKHVPKDFDQMALRLNKDEKNYDALFEEEENKKEEAKIISTIYTDQRVVKEESIEDRNFTGYALEITDNMITSSAKEIKKLEKKITTIDKINTEINNEIERLQVELLYQTVDEQVETNNQVFELQKNIESYEKDKKLLNEDIKNMESKMERLKQKKYDLNI